MADRYQPGGDPSTAAVPTAQVGGERRPVFTDTSAATLFLGRAPTGGRRRVSLAVDVPEALRGRPLRISAYLFDPKTSVVDVKPRFWARPGARQKVRLTLSRIPDGIPFVQVLGRDAPEGPQVTGPITVPPAARLRFGIGVDEEEWPPGLPAVRFRLSVLGNDEESVLFSDQLDPAAKVAERRWADREVDLARYAGRTIRLRFAAEPVAPRAGAPFVYPAWSDPTLVAPQRDGARPPNVILVSLDTLRADHLGCYGYRRPTSPTIDAVLAARGTLFERAYAHFPGTWGSHMSLLTSLYPCVHQTKESDGGRVGQARPDAHMLAELLRATGYATAAFTEDGYVTAGSGFARGFGTFVESTVINVNQPSGEEEATLRRARAWLGDHGDVPWFLFIHTYQVHYPYAPPSGYLEQVLAPGTDVGDSLAAALYDGEIRYTDDLLAEFLAELDANGTAANTLIVLFSDHGDQFGERGLYKHGNSLYDDLLHVPLIMRAPGRVPAGLRVTAPVGLIDVVPTVLELLGLPPPRWTQGRSLVPLLAGRPIPGSPLYASLPLFNLVAVRRDKLKWIIETTSGRSQVFDTFVDPHETIDIAPTQPRDLASSLLLDYQAACTTPPPPPAFEHAVDPAVKEKLKALGYVE